MRGIRYAMTPLSITYRFTLADGSQENFDLRIDPRTVTLILDTTDVPPAWTRLGFHQCHNCPMSEAREPFCSVAMNLVDLVDRFARLSSFDQLFVEVITDARIYYKMTSAQRGISSLMGLLIAASRCPNTDFFKPMARFHLPFSTNEETIWRAASTFMMAQFFRHRESGPADFDMAGLQRIYEDIQRLNVAIAKRLRAACAKDSTINAIIILDAFAQSLPFIIDESLEELRPMMEHVLRRLKTL